MIADIVQCWSQAKKRALAQGRQPLAVGDWITWRNAAGHGRLGRVARTMQNGACGVELFYCDQSHRLSPAGMGIRYDPATAAETATRARVWLDKPELEEERRRSDGMPADQIRQHMTPRKPAKQPTWRLAGHLHARHLVDPTQWTQSGWPTLTAPTQTSLARMQNHHL